MSWHAVSSSEDSGLHPRIFLVAKMAAMMHPDDVLETFIELAALIRI